MCWVPGAAPPREPVSTEGGEAEPIDDAQVDTVRVEQAAPVQAESLATGTGSTTSSSDSYEEPECIVPQEAPPWEPLTYSLVPDEPARVLLATLELPPGAYFRPPTSSCQDVIVLVRDGELEAGGAGMAPHGARASLYGGDAVRFGPEGDGMLINTSGTSARTLLAVARDARRFQRTSGWENLAPQGSDCAPLDRPFGASPLRVGSIATTERLAASADMTVQIMLDTEGHGAENAGLAVLEGTPTVAVPTHTHDGSAEILLVDEGSGTLTLGEREIAVSAGARLYIPQGVPHSYAGDGTSRLRAIQLYAPSGPEQRFRAAAP